MKQRRRIYYSAAQRSEIWDRWQAGEPMSSIGRRFDRESSSVFSVISPTGGIRPGGELVAQNFGTFATWGNSGIEPDKGKRISSPGKYGASLMRPCNDGERQWNFMSDLTCR